MLGISSCNNGTALDGQRGESPYLLSGAIVMAGLWKALETTALDASSYLTFWQESIPIKKAC